MPHMGPENPIKALLLVYYNNKFCPQSKRKPPNKRTKNKENFLALLYAFSTVKQALVRIFGFSLPALPDPVIFSQEGGGNLLSHGLRRASSPLSGELANAVSLRGFTLSYIYHLFIDNKPHFAVN